MSKESNIKVRLKAFTEAAGRKIKGFCNTVNTRFTALGKRIKSFFSIGGAIGRAGILAVLAMMFKGAVKATAGFEQTRIAYETMLGSASRAKKVLDELTKFSTVTPFEPEEVYAAGKALLAFGEDADDLVTTLRKLGDVSAGTGKPLRELVAVYGKIRTKGKAQAEELNMLAEAGIPIIQTLAKMYHKTGEEIYDMASKGEIGFGKIQDAFNEMTREGSQFGGMMQKQSESLGGIWSTLVGNITEVAKRIANNLLPQLKNAAREANNLAINIGKAYDAAPSKKELGRAAKKSDPLDVAGRALIKEDMARKSGDRKYVKRVNTGSFLLPKYRNVVNIPQADKEAWLDQHNPGWKEKNAATVTEEKRNQAVKEAEAKKAAAEAEQRKLQAAATAAAEAEQRKLQAAADKIAAKQQQKVDEQIAAMREKLHIQQLILKGKEREAAIEAAITKAEKAAGGADRLADPDRDAVTRLAAQQYDTSAADERQKQLLALNERPQNIVTDSLLRIGGRHGGQADQSVNIQKRLASLTDVIKQRVELIEQKTPWPEDNSASSAGAWR